MTRNLTRSLRRFESTVPLKNTFCISVTCFGILYCKQEDTETVYAYLTRIKLKLGMCEYSGEVMQEMTCDKLVFGLIDDRIKERLLREEKLDLLTAVGIVQ